MVISDIKSLNKSITTVTFVEQPPHRSDKERWAVCMTIDSYEGTNELFIEYKVLHRVETTMRMWRSVDAALKAIKPFFVKYPTLIIRPLNPPEKPHEIPK